MYPFLADQSRSVKTSVTETDSCIVGTFKRRDDFAGCVVCLLGYITHDGEESFSKVLYVTFKNKSQYIFSMEINSVLWLKNENSNHMIICSVLVLFPIS